MNEIIDFNGADRPYVFFIRIEETASDVQQA
jgi:hypothetical protein